MVNVIVESCEKAEENGAMFLNCILRFEDEATGNVLHREPASVSFTEHNSELAVRAALRSFADHVIAKLTDAEAVCKALQGASL